MAQPAVRMKGLRETQKAFKDMGGDFAKDLTGRLKAIAEPIAADVRRELGNYQGASVRTVKVRSSPGRVFVTQRAKKVTGQHAQFGALQQRTILEPALERGGDDVIHGIEGLLNELHGRHGF